MNYCYPCRRALNDAVTCPECGAYDSGMAPPSDRSSDAPAVDTAVLEVLFSEGPDSFESAAPSAPPAPPAEVPEAADTPGARRRSPTWLKKHGRRTLTSAALSVLGGLAAASLVPQHSAGAPKAAPSPERASPDQPSADVTTSPEASPSPERPDTRPARGGVRDRSSGMSPRPRATATERESPASQAPAATIGPPVKARPTPRPSSGSPSPSASPTTPPSASPTASISISPTVSPTPSATGGPITEALRERTGPLRPDLRRSGAVGGTIAGR